MRTRKYSVSVVGGEEQLNGIISLFDLDDDGVRISLNVPDFQFEIQASDYFEALQKMRRDLAPRGLDILCYGSSRHVHPSPMSRSMGGGLKAYRLTMGKQATGPLVDIFDCGPDVDLVSVDEQNRFYEDWLSSLGR